MATFQTAAPATPLASPQSAGYGRWVQTVHSDAKVPLAQGFIGGVLSASTAAILAGCVAYAARWPAETAAPVILVGWLLLALCFTTVLFFRQMQAIQRTWWSAELLAGADYNGDGYIGPPPASSAPIRPLVVGSYHPPTPKESEDAWHATAAWFVQRCFQTGKRGEKAHVGQIKPDGRRFTQAEYDALVDVLMRARYAVPRNALAPRQGWIWRDERIRSEDIIAGLRRYAT